MFLQRLLISALVFGSAGLAHAQSSASSSKVTLSLVEPDKVTLTSPDERVDGLSVKTVDPSGHPIAGVTIEFYTDTVSCIPLDPSCSLPPGSLYGGFPTGTVDAITDEDGVATAHGFIGGESSGTYNVAALLSLADSAKNAGLIDGGHDLAVKFQIEQDLSSFAIQPATTGSWFDPRYSGQGFSLEVPSVSDGPQLLLVYFYTFDASGNNLWLVGSGPAYGNAATISMYKVEGGAFPPSFDPSKITNTKTGELKFQFTDCDDGQAEWTPDASQTGLTGTQFELTRITKISGLDCH